MPLKVLLVDDEFLVRLGIKSLIDWEAHPFIYAGDAQDGQEALAMIASTRPDILLTDIVMPRMNGIELIERVRREYPDIHIIVLSSHNDYEYVRKAMKMGVADYILKASLKPEELLQMLYEVSGKIAANRTLQQGELETESVPMQRTERLTPRLKAWLLSNPKEGEITDEDQAFFQSGYALTVIKLHDSESLANGGNKQKLMNLIGLQLKKEADGLYREMTEDEIALLVPYKEKGFTTITNAVSFGEELIAAAERFMNISISLGMSEGAAGIEGMPDAYTRARRALQLYFYEGAAKVYVYSPSVETSGAAQAMPSEDLAVLKLELERRHAAGIKAVLTRIFDRIAESKGPVDPCMQTCLGLLHTIQSGLQPPQNDALKQLQREEPLFKQMLKLDELGKIRQWFEQLIELSCGTESSAAGGRVREEIQRLMTYMKAHYAEALSLKQAAEMVNMTENYVSYLFKKEMEVGFTEYLNQLRVGKAAELLLETRLPVYVIAEKVGYENFNYFGRVFKKIIGDSPQHYRTKFQSPLA